MEDEEDFLTTPADLTEEEEEDFLAGADLVEEPDSFLIDLVEEPDSFLTGRAADLVEEDEDVFLAGAAAFLAGLAFFLGLAGFFGLVVFFFVVLVFVFFFGDSDFFTLPLLTLFVALLGGFLPLLPARFALVLAIAGSFFSGAFLTMSLMRVLRRGWAAAIAEERRDEDWEGGLVATVSRGTLPADKASNEAHPSSLAKTANS